jgi:hypothetical protein
MRAFAVLLLAAVVLAGCSANAQDPFAYAKKPLYTGHFELDPLVDGKTDSQEFRVEDGSIGYVRVQVWVNDTAGDATVEVLDPSGRAVLTTSANADQSFPLNLGVWKVVVRGAPDAEGKLSGNVGVLVTRK